MHNLYPILCHFGIRPKYIVTKTTSNHRAINDRFPGTHTTSDIEEVLRDDEVRSVFVCAHPKSHYLLVKKILQADKNVFVEKPPCESLLELDDLIDQEQTSNGFCQVGLQKRFAPCHLKLKGRPVTHYNYKFLTGLYPEGDPLLDVFIHPLDLVVYLFGGVRELSVVSIEQGQAVTFLLTLTHTSGISGVLELSTAYSWEGASEEMVLNTPKGIYSMRDTESLSYQPKHGSIWGVPKEKIFSKHLTQTFILHRNSNPILQNNPLYTSGYYSEVKKFLDLTASLSSQNHATLSSCRATYILMQEIKTSCHVQ